MAVAIVIVNPDKTETHYASVDLIPDGPLKTEIKRIILHNPTLHTIVKVLQ